MYEKTFEVSEYPRITVEDCVGNLSIRSSDSNLVTVKMPDEEDTLVFDQDGDAIFLTIKDNGSITCPVNSAFNIVNTRGNLKVRGIEGDITIGTVNGNTSLRSSGSVNMDTCHGSLRLKSSEGEVDINKVSGSARVQNVSGACKINGLEGSLRASGLEGGLTATVGADARLNPPYTPGETYLLTVGSDLVIELPEEPNVSFSITAGSQVKSTMPDVDIVKEGGTAVGRMGDGEATISATVGGSAVLKSVSESATFHAEDFEFDFDPQTFAFLEELGPMIEASVNSAMSQVDMHLEEGLKYFDSEEFKAKMEKVAEKAKRAAERVEQQAEGIAERARQQAQHAAERAQMRAQQAERRWQRASGQRTAEPAAPPQPTAVDDKRHERLRILKMVEEGTINAEDAAKLLTALG
jgi:hypothetical protein